MISTGKPQAGMEKSAAKKKNDGIQSILEEGGETCLWHAACLSICSSSYLEPLVCMFRGVHDAAGCLIETNAAYMEMRL